MMDPVMKVSASVEALSNAFFLNHPKDAAQKIASMLPTDAAILLADQPVHTVLRVWHFLPPGVVENIVLQLSEQKIKELLANMDSGPCAALLNRLDSKEQARIFALLDDDLAKEIRELLDFPADSAGALMDTNVTAFNENMTVGRALTQLRNQKVRDINHLYLLNNDMFLSGQVPVQRLALAKKHEKLSSLSVPLQAWVSALDPKDVILGLLEKFQMAAVPVVDGNDHFVGVIRGRDMLGALKESLGTEILTMVGVSKEERALSSSWFTVKKRLPWLQINLLTAFLAAAVVGLFEATIAQYTALAILLPIAAGQSGNTGAQALAVTMRGLTLREITVRHWFRVLRKEAGAGIVNGIAIAITCGGGVYIWSQNSGLALIIGLAMISSMTIAAVAGAVVPILLQRLGQDPALSSSIILTTITDIAGFMSFLGIATLLSGMLAAG